VQRATDEVTVIAQKEQEMKEKETERMALEELEENQLLSSADSGEGEEESVSDDDSDNDDEDGLGSSFKGPQKASVAPQSTVSNGNPSNLRGQTLHPNGRATGGAASTASQSTANSQSTPSDSTGVEVTELPTLYETVPVDVETLSAHVTAAFDRSSHLIEEVFEGAQRETRDLFAESGEVILRGLGEKVDRMREEVQQQEEVEEEEELETELQVSL
jgi:hypothetical protein